MWADVLPGSIYHALKQMATEGLIALQATEQSGHRVRAVYAITPAGKAELQRLLREAWRMPPHSYPTNIYAALAFFAELPPAEIRAALDYLLTALEQELLAWNDGETIRERMGQLTDPVRACFTNGREHLEADLRLLRRLRETL
jgi:DNA-binding PadR family transcriptional regulator